MLGKYRLYDTVQFNREVIQKTPRKADAFPYPSSTSWEVALDDAEMIQKWKEAQELESVVDAY
jgi:hypothetical protein